MGTPRIRKFRHNPPEEVQGASRTGGENVAKQLVCQSEDDDDDDDDGEGPDVDQVFADLYASFRQLAGGYMRGQHAAHTLQATALVHEAWVRLHAQDPERWASTEHVLAVAARAMRQVLVDHARTRGRQKRRGGGVRVPLEGLVDIDISGNQGYEYEGLVLATVGSDTALLPHWGWDRNAAVDRLVWHTFTDRGIYRPGETMRLKGWVRNLTLSGNAQIELFDSGSNVAYTVWDPQGNELASGTTALSSLGGFDLAVDIPAGSNLGYAWLDLSIPGRDSYGTQFRIEEFRRPEFEVRTWPDSPGPYLLTQPATVGR